MVIFDIDTSPSTPSIVGGGIIVVLVNTAAATWEANGIVHLPALPENGVRIYIKDSGGVSGTKPILVLGSGFLVDTQASYTIQNPFESLLVTYDGMKWVVL